MVMPYHYLITDARLQCIIHTGKLQVNQEEIRQEAGGGLPVIYWLMRVYFSLSVFSKMNTWFHHVKRING